MGKFHFESKVMVVMMMMMMMMMMKVTTCSENLKFRFFKKYFKPWEICNTHELMVLGFIQNTSDFEKQMKSYAVRYEIILDQILEI